MRLAIGPLISCQGRRLKLALGATRIDDDRVWSTKYRRGNAILQRGKPKECGVIHADELKRLKSPVWKARVRRGQSQRHGERYAVNTADAGQRRIGYVRGLLAGLHRRVHDPHVRAWVLGDESKSTRHETTEVGRGERDQE